MDAAMLPVILHLFSGIRKRSQRSSAFRHEKSYPRVGFLPHFFPRMASPYHSPIFVLHHSLLQAYKIYSL